MLAAGARAAAPPADDSGCVASASVVGGQVLGELSGVAEVWEVAGPGPGGDRRLWEPFAQPCSVVIAEPEVGKRLLDAG